MELAYKEMTQLIKLKLVLLLISFIQDYMHIYLYV